MLDLNNHFDQVRVDSGAQHQTETRIELIHLTVGVDPRLGLGDAASTT